MVDGSQLAQVQCDNRGRVGHPREHCFDLYLELKSGRGGATQRGRGGRGGGGGKGTLTVGAPPAAIPPPMIEVTMAAKIK